MEGEGASLGAALHAAWVWLNENGEEVSLEEVTTPFVIKTETRRRRPQDHARSAYDLQRRLFHSLALRIRGKPGEDPFILRDQLARMT